MILVETLMQPFIPGLLSHRNMNASHVDLSWSLTNTAGLDDGYSYESMPIFYYFACQVQSSNDSEASRTRTRDHIQAWWCKDPDTFLRMHWDASRQHDVDVIRITHYTPQTSTPNWAIDITMCFNHLQVTIDTINPGRAFDNSEREEALIDTEHWRSLLSPTMISPNTQHLLQLIWPTLDVWIRLTSTIPTFPLFLLHPKGDSLPDPFT